VSEYYLRSAGGSDSNTGAGDFSNAKATLFGGIGLCVPGDTLFVSQAHNETGATTKTITSAGTPDNPVRILAVNDANLPPTELSTAARVATGSAGNIALQGSVAMYGMTFSSGTGSNVASVLMGTNSATDVVQSHQNCTFYVGSTNAAAVIQLGSSTNTTSSRSRFNWKDCNARLGNVAGRIDVFQDFLWRGGALQAGPALSYLMRVGVFGRTCRVEVDGVDFSEMAATTDLVSGPLSNGKISFRNCLMPAGWTGQPVQGLIDPSLRVSLYNCDVANASYPELTSYPVWVMTFAGSIRSDTGVLKAAGASDGVAASSLRMVTNANAVWYSSPLETDEFFIWNDKVGSAVTLSLDVVSDGALLTNADAWLEVQYLGSANQSLGRFTSGRAGLLEQATAHPASAATWSGTGAMVTPRKQRLSVTFTAQEVGPVLCRVMLGKPNTTIYVDQKRAA